MRMTGHRGVGARLTTSVLGLLVGSAGGFSGGLALGAILTFVMSHVGTTDTEGWGYLWLWVGLAFFGALVGAVIGLVVGYRRRPVPPAPPRPDPVPALERTS